jgi:hypothetical protein
MRCARGGPKRCVVGGQRTPRAAARDASLAGTPADAARFLVHRRPGSVLEATSHAAALPPHEEASWGSVQPLVHVRPESVPKRVGCSLNVRHFLASRYDPESDLRGRASCERLSSPGRGNVAQARDSLVYIMLSAFTLFLTKAACVRAFARIPGALFEFSVGYVPGTASHRRSPGAHSCVVFEYAGIPTAVVTRKGS